MPVQKEGMVRVAGQAAGGRPPPTNVQTGARPCGRRRRHHPRRRFLVDGPAYAWSPGQEGREEADTRWSAGRACRRRRNGPAHGPGTAHRDRLQSPLSVASLFLVGAQRTSYAVAVRTLPGPANGGAAHNVGPAAAWERRPPARPKTTSPPATEATGRGAVRPPLHMSLAHDPVRGAPLREGGTGGGLGDVLGGRPCGGRDWRHGASVSLAGGGGCGGGVVVAGALQQQPPGGGGEDTMARWRPPPAGKE